MSRSMFRTFVMTFSVAVVGAGFAHASGPGKSSHETEQNNSSVTVTETEFEVNLKGAAQVAAKGHLESKVVAVTNTTAGTTVTNSYLTIGVKGLTLVDGSIVSFQQNGNAIGTGVVKSGRAKLRLSTTKGNTVPTLVQGDVITVVDPDGTTVDLTGTAGAPQTQTESNDR